MMSLSSVCCVYIGGLSGLVMRNAVLDSLVSILFCPELYSVSYILFAHVDLISMIVMLWFEILLYVYQDMIDMRDCYDRLLSAAAATANSVYGILIIWRNLLIHDAAN